MTKNKPRRANENLLPIFGNRIGGEIGNRPSTKEVKGYLSPKNAAKYLDVSVKFIYELMQKKQIEAQPVGGRLKRIKIETLDKWLAAQAMKFER